MYISELRTKHFRNLASESINFLDGFNILVGNNAQGKTSILEAVSILGNLQSFRASKLRDVIRFGEKTADLLGRFRDEYSESELMIRVDSHGRRILRDGKYVRKAEEIIRSFPVTTFSPDDLGLIKGGAAIRRRFLDKGCYIFDKSYFEYHRKYHKALLSRNKLLKGRIADESLMDTFERIMASSGTAIRKIRRSMVQSMSTTISSNEKYHHKIGKIEIIYNGGIDIDSEDEYKQLLLKKREVDVHVGHTTIGPHRDDFDVLVGGYTARDFASQGQQRILAISLILAMVDETKKKNIEPILLMDDISSELDKIYRKEIFLGLQPIARQILVTTTDETMFDGLGIPARYIQVDSGRCTDITREKN